MNWIKEISKKEYDLIKSNFTNGLALPLYTCSMFDEDIYVIDARTNRIWAVDGPTLTEFANLFSSLLGAGIQLSPVVLGTFYPISRFNIKIGPLDFTYEELSKIVNASNYLFKNKE